MYGPTNLGEILNTSDYFFLANIYYKSTAILVQFCEVEVEYDGETKRPKLTTDWSRSETNTYGRY